MKSNLQIFSFKEEKVVFVFWDGSHYVPLAGLELTEACQPVSHMLRLEACANMLSTIYVVKEPPGCRVETRGHTRQENGVEK